MAFACPDAPLCPWLRVTCNIRAERRSSARAPLPPLYICGLNPRLQPSCGGKGILCSPHAATQPQHSCLLLLPSLPPLETCRGPHTPHTRLQPTLSWPRHPGNAGGLPGCRPSCGTPRRGFAGGAFRPRWGRVVRGEARATRLPRPPTTCVQGQTLGQMRARPHVSRGRNRAELQHVTDPSPRSLSGARRSRSVARCSACAALARASAAHAPRPGTPHPTPQTFHDHCGPHCSTPAAPNHWPRTSR